MRVEVVVLVLYFIGMIGMGLYWNKKSKKSEDYMLGGRSMGPLVTALTLQTTAMSGYMFMGGPALAYALGWFAIFYAVGDAGGGLINVTVLGRRMRRLSQLLDCISPIEYLEKRYQSVPVKIIACAIAIFGLSGYVLAQFLAAGKTLVSLFNFPFVPGLIAIIQPPAVFGLVIFSFGVMASAFLPSYVCAIWWKKANATGSCLSMIFGGGTAFVWTALKLEDTTGQHPFLVGVIASTIAMIIGSQFGKPTSPEMMALMDRAAAKNAKISPKLEGAASKSLATEGRAVSQFVNNTSFMQSRGFQIS